MCYSGHFSQKVILALMNALEMQSRDIGLNKSIAKKLYVTFIELFQNIMKYSIKDYTKNLDSEKIIIEHNSNSYFITSTNNVRNDSIDNLQDTLMEITTLDKQEVTQRYNELRRSGEKSHTNGGGIGLYQVARKVDAISYAIKKETEEESLLTITIQIYKNEENN